MNRNGLTVLENLALACSGCNGHKYDKTEALDPLTQEVVPLFHPRQPEGVLQAIRAGDYFTFFYVKLADDQLQQVFYQTEVSINKTRAHR